MAISFERFKSPLIVFLHDLIAVPVAWFGAYWLRYNLDFHSINEQAASNGLSVLPLLMTIQGSLFWYFGLYRGVWRFASIPDLLRLLKAVFTGLMVSAIAIFMVTRMHGIPRSILPLYGILLVAILAGARLLYRSYIDNRRSKRSKQRVLVVGAGKAGELLIRELKSAIDYHYAPVAIVDDDRRKKGRSILGVEVQGGTKDIAALAKRHAVDLLVIAIHAASAVQMRAIVEKCENVGLPFRILPKIQDIMSGRATINDLREVSIHDLLGRDPVKLDWSSIHSSIDGKSILVTGGGGSIGSELCRQIAKLKPHTLMVLENTEFNLYQIELEMRQTFPDLSFVAVLGSVTDPIVVNQVLATYQPHVIYHAAAYKHVPMLEHNVRQAVINNIKGTRTIAKAAARFNVQNFVLISTDKAVNPQNVMGCTKRIAEIFCQNFNQHTQTCLTTVRFGNVLGSAGSVVPLFREQIKTGGPLTITHQDMTRFFMTIPEACQLIMEAGAVSQGGEIFVLDMGEPIKIQYLAEQMIRLSGKTPEVDIEIVYTGLRPGEKLYEELFHEQEDLKKTDFNKLLLAKSREYDWQALNDVIDRLTEQEQEADILPLIMTLVPEYSGNKAF